MLGLVECSYNSRAQYSSQQFLPNNFIILEGNEENILMSTSGSHNWANTPSSHVYIHITHTTNLVFI